MTDQPAHNTLRKSRAQRLRRQLLWCVGLPTLLVALYEWGMASDFYESVAGFTVQSSNGMSNSNPLSGLIGIIPGGGGQDALAIQHYITSRDMLTLLNKKHELIKHFKSPTVDWWQRLAGDASFEEAFDYYNDQLVLQYDDRSGVTTVKIRAADPAYARQLLNTILQASEQRVNQLSQRARFGQVHFSQQVVTEAEKRLSRARQEVVKLQNTGADISPQQSAESIISIRTGLEQDLATARAERMQLQSFMQEEAPKMVSLKEKIDALTRMIGQENQRLVGNQDDSLNNSMLRFESVLLEKEMAQQLYQSALATLELASAEAARQNRYLAIVFSPSLPDEESYPQRFRTVLSTAVMALMSFLVLSLLWASIREHARF